MKKFISALLACAMVFSLAACGGGNTGNTGNAGNTSNASNNNANSTGGNNGGDIKPVKLTVYSPGNENAVPTKAIVEYARLVNEASNGAITLDVHHSGELGNDAEAIESTRMANRFSLNSAILIWYTFPKVTMVCAISLQPIVLSIAPLM